LVARQFKLSAALQKICVGNAGTPATELADSLVPHPKPGSGSESGGGMLQSDEIIIVGAGIGGLATALSLHDAGFAVRVFESVPEIKPLGVGINLLPHAVRELEEMGLRERLERVGVACRELSYYTKRGERIWGEPRGIAAGYRWPQISVHRGALQWELLNAAQQRIGADRLHLGQRLVSFDAQPDRGVRVQFADRMSRPASAPVEGRLLIACDGIHSQARSMLYPDEGPPRWSGAVMWRGVAEFKSFLDGHTMIMAGHNRTKFVAYPISHEATRSGAQQINFVAERLFEGTALNEREDWNCPGRLEDFLPAFESFRFDWLDVPALIRAAPMVWVYPMADRDPLPCWTHGPVTLLGDAAHPMYPIGSNGASQAILDARVLTSCLQYYRGDLERGLERYDALRRPATAKIVLANRDDGPEAVLQLVEDRAPDGFSKLEEVVTHAELKATADKYKQLAGFAVAELNERAPLSAPRP
jgi:5-methylphenazine-1-carboxylate 1-monooxygenase